MEFMPITDMEYMTAAEAYRALNLTPGSSEDEVVDAYKVEARLCHPGRDGGAGELKKFKEINHAFSRLLIYRQDYFPSTPLENMLVAYDTLIPNRISAQHKEREANKNAAELIAEEEKHKLKEEQLKRKAEKKRAKKKRRNERRKQQLGTTDSSQKREEASGEVASGAKSSCSDDSGSDDPDKAEEAVLDPVSAFVRKLALRKDIVLPSALSSATAVASQSTHGSVVSQFGASGTRIASNYGISTYLPVTTPGPAGRPAVLSAAASKFVPAVFSSPWPSVLAGYPADETVQTQDKVSRCLELGRLGNAHALNGYFAEAIVCYSEGIRMDPSDYRFLGNRSLCYERLMQFEEALKDADAAIRACESYVKGHYRRGMALLGLKRTTDAELAFEQALKLEPSDEDTRQELAAVRTALLVEMGFAEYEAQQALNSHGGSLQKALEALLSHSDSTHLADAEAAERVTKTDEQYDVVSSAGGSWIEPKTQKADHQKHVYSAAPSVGSPRTGGGGNTGSTSSLTGLWIGDIYEPISEKKLLDLFSRYGGVASVHLLPEKYCAFVNFYQREAAMSAMAGLQHHTVGGNRFRIKLADKTK